jgi:CDP-paratose 2-epimerase
MGKVDQGVFTYWLLAHYFGRPLQYIGFGGEGRQVRDLLHIDDLIDLLDDQLARPDHWSGVTVNVGGGRPCSLSLHEATGLCRALTGRQVDVRAGADRRGDIPIYVSDCSRLFDHADWRPHRGARAILADTLAWVELNESAIRSTLGFD